MTLVSSPDVLRTTRFRHIGSFTLRTPVLPFDTYVRWSALGAVPPRDGSAQSDCAARVREVQAERRDALLLWTRDPFVREALYAASADLIDAIDACAADWQSKRGQRTAIGVLRYMTRMASRSTPFGLFAGCAAGVVGPHTSLTVPGLDGVRRRARVDTQVLSALVESLVAQDDVLAGAPLLLNPTVYRVGPVYRFYARNTTSDGGYRNELLSLTASRAVDVVRESLADASLRLPELASKLSAHGIPVADAGQFVRRLLQLRFVLPDIAVPLTGDYPARALAADLTAIPATADVGHRLDDLATEMDALNAMPLGSDGVIQQQGRLVAQCIALGKPWDANRAVHNEITKSATDRADQPVLGESVVAAIAEAVNALHLAEQPIDDRLRRFREQFLEIYGDREIPLLEVMDEEIGIGFAEETGRFGHPTDLIDTLPAPRGTGSTAAMTARDVALLDMLAGALRDGHTEMELDVELMERATRGERTRLPNYVEMLGSVVAASPDAVNRGEFKIYMHGVFGPTPARMAARFTAGDRALRANVSAALAREEAGQPEVLFAELVHLADPRSANVVAKPVLRRFEIEASGRSGAARDGVIGLTDLLVSIRDGQVVLTSRRLGRQIIPRSTSMHVARDRHLGVYRFLIAVGQQSIRAKLVWDWGAFRSQAFLPRVTVGNTILAPARWRLSPAEVAGLANIPDAADRFAAMQACRDALRLPRWVSFAEGDNLLTVDLDNPVSIDAFLPLARRTETALLVELLPDPAHLVARGVEGQYMHEIVVPLERVEPRRLAVAPRVTSTAILRRHFGPGSEWATLKLYGGPVTLNRLLLDVLVPTLRSLLEAGVLRQWFFLRYRDPETHLRIRTRADHGNAGSAWSAEVARLTQPWLDAGLIRRVQWDTYSREVERYGGPESMEAAEAIFAADSDAVVTMGKLGLLSGSTTWQTALSSLVSLVDSAGFTPAEQAAVFRRTLDQYGGAMFREADYRHAVAEKTRAFRVRIDEACAASEPGAPDTPVRDILSARTRALGPHLARLRDLDKSGALVTPLTDILGSLLHMNANRMFTWGANDHEPILYDIAYRWLSGRAARKQGQGTRAARAASPVTQHAAGDVMAGQRPF